MLVAVVVVDLCLIALLLAQVVQVAVVLVAHKLLLQLLELPTEVAVAVVTAAAPDLVLALAVQE
jgi:hypothetical protein